ncbi:MAG: ferritin family protein [Pseudomonadota bacterium]
MTNQGSIEELFELAISAEKMMQDYYTGVAKKFSHLPQASNFWKDMAKDEEMHIEKLQEARESLAQSQLVLPADPSMLKSIKKVLSISIKQKLDDIVTLDDAYEFAHDAESSEINYIFKFLTIEFMDSRIQDDFIMSLINEHVDKLMDFTKEFGDAAWRKTVKAKGIE